MPSIDEILENHSIHELRDLIIELDKESKLKQGELQQMVGSTYHDFIQSADTITIMKTKSNSMNQQITSFGNITKDISNSSKQLLLQSNNIGGKGKHKGINHLSNRSLSNQIIEEVYWELTDLDISNVWSSLDNCNLFHACQILALNETLDAICHQNIPSKQKEFHSLQISLQEKAQQLIQGLNLKDSTLSQILSQCSSSKYLKQTVVDDCTLLFLYGECSVNDIALAMAGLAGLDLCINAVNDNVNNHSNNNQQLQSQLKSQELSESISGKSLLIKYLDVVEIKLQKLLNQLSTLTFHQDRTSSITSYSEILIYCVRILQETILEIYLLFFQRIQISNSSNDQSTETIQYQYQGNSGLFGYYVTNFIQSLVYTNQQQQQQSNSKYLKNWNEIENLISQHTSSSIFLDIWSKWIRKQIESIQNSSKIAFENIHSASDVSKLQRNIFQSCLSSQFIQDISKRKDHSINTKLSWFAPLQIENDIEKIWSDACINLLETTLTTRWNQSYQAFSTPTSTSTSNNSTSLIDSKSQYNTLPTYLDSGRMMWTYIFRQPFLTLVERLMKVSCHNIFQTIKKRMLRIITNLTSLLQENEENNETKYQVIIDSLTLEMKYSINKKKKSKKSSILSTTSTTSSNKTNSTVSNNKTNENCFNVSKEEKHDDWLTNASNTYASSTEIFLNAEKIKIYLENEITTLMNELLVTEDDQEVNNSDSDATYSLLRSLQIQSGELIGQILILIRTLLFRFTGSLNNIKSYLHVSLPHSFQKNTIKENHQNYNGSLEYLPEIPVDIQQSSLLNGVMFLSRLIWLFRSPSGDFLSKVLNSSSSQLKSLARHHQYQYMTTIEQIQSAFDIADTDGDGYLSWEEAVEAVQALWIEPNSITSTSSISNNKENKDQDYNKHENEHENENNINNSNSPNYFDFLWYDSPILVKNQSIKKLSLIFSLDEFRLVCSQMIAPPLHISTPISSTSTSSSSSIVSIHIPSECLKRSLESLLVNSTTTWYRHFTENLRKSFRFELSKMFPFENFTSSSINNNNNNHEEFKKFLNKPNFKNNWKNKVVSLDGNECEDNSNVEKVKIPSQPSSIISKYLKSIAFLLYHTSLSIDTTLQLYDEIKFKSKNNTNISVKSLWEYNKSICYDLSLNVFEEELIDRHTKITTWINKLPSIYQLQQQQLNELFEEYCLQMLFDIMLCFHSLSLTPIKNVSMISSSTTSTIPTSSISLFSSLNSISYDTYYNSIDPVNVSFLQPFIEDEYQQYLQQNNLFLPGSDQRMNIITNLLDSVGRNINPINGNSSIKNQEIQSEELLKSLFALYTPSSSSPSSSTTTTTVVTPSTPGSINSINTNKGNKTNPSNVPISNNRFSLLPLPITLNSTNRPGIKSTTGYKSKYEGNTINEITDSNSKTVKKEEKFVSGSNLGTGTLSSVFKGFQNWSSK